MKGQPEITHGDKEGGGGNERNEGKTGGEGEKCKGTKGEQEVTKDGGGGNGRKQEEGWEKIQGTEVREQKKLKELWIKIKQHRIIVQLRRLLHPADGVGGG